VKRTFTPPVVLVFVSPGTLNAAEPCLSDDKLSSYVAQFNADDREVFARPVPNAKTREFLVANAARFECPDDDIERAYYFRWWTYRKQRRVYRTFCSSLHSPEHAP
jgi:hypothetical protein